MKNELFGFSKEKEKKREREKERKRKREGKGEKKKKRKEKKRKEKPIFDPGVGSGSSCSMVAGIPFLSKRLRAYLQSRLYSTTKEYKSNSEFV